MRAEQTSQDLTCAVCRELPERQILQCTNGHIICESDYGKILLSTKTICPVCRVKLDRNSPIRNVFAENILANLVVPCTNAGCDSKVMHSKLNMHVKQDCIHREVVCKYNALGCTWCGVASQQNQHQSACNLVTKHIDDILSAVTKNNEAAAAERKWLETKCKNDAILTALLSKRCVDFTLHNLVFPSSGKSGKFSPVGLDMVAILDQECAPESIEFVLKSVKPIKHRTIVEVFILLSDDMPFQMPLYTGRLTFSATHTCSERITLNLTPHQAQELYGLPNIALRIGSLDCTPGDMVAAFNSAHEENDPTLGGFIADDGEVEDPSESDNDDDYNEGEHTFMDDAAEEGEEDAEEEGHEEDDDEEEEEERKPHRRAHRRSGLAETMTASPGDRSRRRKSAEMDNDNDDDECDEATSAHRPSRTSEVGIMSAAHLPRRRGRFGRGSK